MIVIDTDGKVRRVKYSGYVQQILKELDCELFDIVHVNIGDIHFDIFVDDEGLFNPKHLEDGRPKWNLLATHLRMLDWIANKERIVWRMARHLPPLAGNAVILANNGDGDTIDIDDATNEFILTEIGEDVTMEYSE